MRISSNNSGMSGALLEINGNSKLCELLKYADIFYRLQFYMASYHMR